MKPHDSLSQLRVDRSTVPAPKFQLFDVATLTYTSEFGEVSREPIQILGITWNPDYSKVKGWWYHVRYLRKPIGTESHLPAGWQDNCSEAELSTPQF